MKNQDQDLLAHIIILPPHANTEELIPTDYQMKEGDHIGKAHSGHG